MRRSVQIILTDKEKEALTRTVRSRISPIRDILRADIVLLSAKDMNNKEIACELDCNIHTVSLWRNRFFHDRLKSLKDRPGRGRKPIYDDEKEAEIIATTLTPPDDATHWSARRLAKKVGVSKSTVHRIWKDHDLQPHIERTFKYSKDPLLVEKVVDIIGLYLNPPENALVLSVDEKSQIQALERSQPILPLGPGRPAARTHDYKRNGTTTLFAALNLTNPEVIGRCSKRHRHQEFLLFLSKINIVYPKGEIHLVMDNYGTHKHANVKKWFAKRPRFHIHFTPTSASWMNQVETWFSILTRQHIRRGDYSSEMKLQKSIHHYIREWNKRSVPFNWVKTTEQVLAPYNNSQ